MIDQNLENDLKELSSAEEFLEYFGIAFDPAVVQVNRLHILQRFRDYLDKAKDEPTSVEGWWGFYAGYLEQAYRDFTTSDALTEKVFKVLKTAERKPAFVPVEHLLR